MASLGKVGNLMGRSSRKCLVIKGRLKMANIGKLGN